MGKQLVASLCASIAILTLGSASLAQPFQPKKIRFVIGAAPGQDYDIWARLIGRYLPRHMPGAPTVVVENMPGGGHLIAANWLYNVAPRDGTVWGMFSRNVPHQALLKLPTARFDPLKFNWIGSPELTNRGCFAMTRSGVVKADQLFEKTLIVGGTGAGSAVSQTPMLLKSLLGMNFKVIEGYEKPQDAVRAMESGELGGICQTVQSFARERGDLFKSGAAHVLFTLKHRPVEEFGAPTIYDFVKTNRQKQVLDFYSSTIELGRPIMLPPGVPFDRVEAARKAFDDTMNDADFRREATKLGLDVTLTSGTELAKIILSSQNIPQDIIEETSKLTDGVVTSQ